MSETVHYRGRLELVKSDKTLEDQIRELLPINKLPKYYDDWEEYFSEYFYEEYIIIDNKIYKPKYENIYFNDIFRINKVKEDYEFEIKYYNGGCNFNEAIRIALEEE